MNATFLSSTHHISFHMQQTISVQALTQSLSNSKYNIILNNILKNILLSQFDDITFMRAHKGHVVPVPLHLDL